MYADDASDVADMFDGQEAAAHKQRRTELEAECNANSKLQEI